MKAAFWGLTAMLAVGLAGLIGYYQGFARALGMTDLDRSIPALVADGVQMLRDAPAHVFDAGLTGTGEWLAAIASTIAGGGLLAIAVLATLRPPSAVVSGERGGRSARPDVPPDLARASASASASSGSSNPPDRDAGAEQPGPSAAAATLVALGGTLVLIAACLHAGWTIRRHHDLGMLSILDASTSLNDWIATARLSAGIDIIALIGGVIWLLFAMRLPPIFPWLRILSITLMGAAVALAFAAASTSVGSMTQIKMKRPVVELRPFLQSMDENQDQATGSDGADAADDAAGPSGPADDAIDSSSFVPGVESPALIVGRSGAHLVLLREPGRPIMIPSNTPLAVAARMNISDFLLAMRRNGDDASSDDDDDDETSSPQESENAEDLDESSTGG